MDDVVLSFGLLGLGLSILLLSYLLLETGSGIIATLTYAVSQWRPSTHFCVGASFARLDTRKLP